MTPRFCPVCLSVDKGSNGVCQSGPKPLHWLAGILQSHRAHTRLKTIGPLESLWLVQPIVTGCALTRETSRCPREAVDEGDHLLVGRSLHQAEAGAVPDCGSRALLPRSI
jgi:hypothetical protein